MQLNSGSWRPYSLNMELAAGDHELRLAFVNDANLGGEDRNLKLNKVTFFREHMRQSAAADRVVERPLEPRTLPDLCQASRRPGERRLDRAAERLHSRRLSAAWDRLRTSTCKRPAEHNLLVSLIYGQSAFLAALGSPHNRVDNEHGTPLFEHLYQSDGYLGQAHLLRLQQQDRDSPGPRRTPRPAGDAARGPVPGCLSVGK